MTPLRTFKIVFSTAQESADHVLTDLFGLLHEFSFALALSFSDQQTYLGHHQREFKLVVLEQNLNVTHFLQEYLVCLRQLLLIG